MWTDTTAFIICMGDNMIQQINMRSREKKMSKLSMCLIGTNTCARMIWKISSLWNTWYSRNK